MYRRPPRWTNTNIKYQQSNTNNKQSYTIYLIHPIILVITMMIINIT